MQPASPAPTMFMGSEDDEAAEVEVEVGLEEDEAVVVELDVELAMAAVVAVDESMRWMADEFKADAMAGRSERVNCVCYYSRAGCGWQAE